MKITITLPDDVAAQYIADRDDRGYGTTPGWVPGVQGLVERIVAPVAAAWTSEMKALKLEAVGDLYTVSELDALVGAKKP